MSYSVFIQKFVNGGIATVPFDVAKRVLERYGQLHRGISGYELNFDTDEIAEIADVVCEDDGGVSGINLSRATGSATMLRFVFAVLQELEMCFFTQDCEAIWAAADLREHVPPDLLSQAGDRFEVAARAEDLWTDRVSSGGI